jgi:hypothetical protein
VPRALEKLYFAYLLSAPLGAAVMAFVTYAGPPDLMIGLLYFGGAIAISIYAAFVGSYLVAPRVWWRALLVILDGPLWMLVAAATLHGWHLLELMTWFFAAESLGIYIAIALVAVRKAGPQAPASIGIMAACAAVVCFGCGWGLWPMLAHDGRAAAMFALSIAQATYGAHSIVDRDETVRDADKSAFVILAALGLFHVALGLGALLRFVILR